MKKIIITLLVLLGIAMLAKNLMSDHPLVQLGSAKLVNPYAPTSPLYASHQAFVDKFNGNPKLVARFSGTASSKGLYAMWRAALNRGARSLPRQRLIEVAKTQVALLPRMPEASCAKMIRPREEFDQALGADIRSAIEQLPPRHHQVITEFMYDALVAEVDDAPVIAVDDEALKGALISLGQRFPGEYGERLVGVLRNPNGASDADACWAANSLMNTTTQLPDEFAEALLRKSFGG
jgi:hypothetical protein